MKEKIDAKAKCCVITSLNVLNEDTFKNAVNLEEILMDKEIFLKNHLVLDFSNCINLNKIEIPLKSERDKIRNSIINFLWRNDSDKIMLKDIFSGKVLDVSYNPIKPIVIDRSCIGLCDVDILPPNKKGSDLEIKMEDVVLDSDFLYAYIQGKSNKITINRDFYDLGPITVDLVKAEDKYDMVNMNENLFKKILIPETEEITMYYATVIEEACKSHVLRDINSFDVIEYDFGLIKKNKHDLHPIKILIK